VEYEVLTHTLGSSSFSVQMLTTDMWHVTGPHATKNVLAWLPPEQLEEKVTLWAESKKVLHTVAQP
jgi:hypothetical protein